MKDLDDLIERWRSQPLDSRLVIMKEINESAIMWTTSTDDELTKTDACTMKLVFDILERLNEG